MRRLGIVLALLFVLIPAAGRAAPVALQLTYVTYAAGFTTVRLNATLQLAPEGYRLTIAYRTVGTIGFLFPGHAVVTSDGTWRAGGAAPLAFQSQGVWGGRRFDVRLDYRLGQPVIRRLVPDESRRREAVPAAEQAHSIDTLAAMALLFHNEIAGRGCALALKVFDGRRLIALSAHPAGSEALGVTMRSFFHGPAEHCEVSGRMLAGFLYSDGSAERRRVYHGSVWFAHPIPALPLLPVRMAFSTKWFGQATMYLTDIRAAPPLASDGPARVALGLASPIPQGSPVSH